MNLTYVQEFLTLAKCLNYSAAAMELGITKDALSHHIMKLEKDLGLSLFYRTTRTVELTSAGHSFLPYAMNLIDTYSSYRSYQQTGENGHLVIGSFRSISPYGISNAISTFSEKHPDIQTSILESHSNSLINMMLQGKCDCSFIMHANSDQYPGLKKSFHVYHYYTDHYVVVLPEHHPLASRSALALDDIRNERLSDPLWAKRLHCTKPPFTTTNENVALWTSYGHWLAILPELEALFQCKNLEHIKVLPLTEEGLQTEICFLYPKVNSSAAIQLFLEHIHSYNSDMAKL